MATTSYGTPYVQSSDLVSGWPTASLNVANRIDQVSYAGNGINAQTVTSYTLAVTDAGKLVTLNNAAAVTVSLPQDSTANLPVGSVTRIYNLGAGVVTVQAGAGATLQGGSVTVAQYDACNVTKLSANTYGIAAKSGLVLITNATLSGSSVSVNGCFTSTFDAYRILVAADSLSTTAALFIRLRASGTDNTSANYSYAYYRHVISSGALANYSNGATETQFGVGEANSNQPYTVGIDIHNPSRTAKTTISWLGDSDTSHYSGGGITTVTTAYDGFTIYPSAGTVTGSLRVYGYKNA